MQNTVNADNTVDTQLPLSQEAIFSCLYEEQGSVAALLAKAIQEGDDCAVVSERREEWLILKKCCERLAAYDSENFILHFKKLSGDRQPFFYRQLLSFAEKNVDLELLKLLFKTQEHPVLDRCIKGFFLFNMTGFFEKCRAMQDARLSLRMHAMIDLFFEKCHSIDAEDFLGLCSGEWFKKAVYCNLPNVVDLMLKRIPSEKRVEIILNSGERIGSEWSNTIAFPVIYDHKEMMNVLLSHVPENAHASDVLYRRKTICSDRHEPKDSNHDLRQLYDAVKQLDDEKRQNIVTLGAQRYKRKYRENQAYQMLFKRFPVPRDLLRQYWMSKAGSFLTTFVKKALLLGIGFVLLTVMCMNILRRFYPTNFFVTSFEQNAAPFYRNAMLTGVVTTAAKTVFDNSREENRARISSRH